MRGAPLLVGLLLAGAIAGCGGNRYSYARTYQPYGDEGPFLERAVELSYQDVRRFPDRHSEALIAWWGTVSAIDELNAATGEARLTLQYRTYRERHLCQDERDHTCRVTVSQRTIGPFQVLLTVRPEDLVDGTERLWTGSLLKVYGHVTDAGTEESGPTLTVEHYRHFPHGTFVTTAAAGSMRQ